LDSLIRSLLALVQQVALAKPLALTAATLSLAQLPQLAAALAAHITVPTMARVCLVGRVAVVLLNWRMAQSPHPELVEQELLVKVLLVVLVADSVDSKLLAAAVAQVQWEQTQPHLDRALAATAALAFLPTSRVLRSLEQVAAVAVVSLE
jgi:hypothetical protein